MSTPLSDAELLAAADAVSARAYAPYSHFRVGCAVLARDGRVIEGVNVENAAYPLGVCAERTALSRAVAEGYGPGDFAVAAITASPCGGCRQFLPHPRSELSNASGSSSPGVIVTTRPPLRNTTRSISISSSHCLHPPHGDAVIAATAKSPGP